LDGSARFSIYHNAEYGKEENYMKKSVTFLTIALFFMGTLMALADQPLDKLGRGVANVVTSPVEVFYRAGKGEGVSNGLGMAIRRMFTGMIEVLTFPLPSVPFMEETGEYEPIITDPEFFLQKNK